MTKSTWKQGRTRPSQVRFLVLAAASMKMTVFWDAETLAGEISGSHGGEYEDDSLLGC
jgi:hypothetical protein